MNDLTIPETQRLADTPEGRRALRILNQQRIALGLDDNERAIATQQQKLELAKLRDAFEDAIALLRDWEDYDINDSSCTWHLRRDEFLAEHEEAGR